MPRRNRVTPFGDIVATPERGAFMGNRGNLFNIAGRIARTFGGPHWIICRLDFKGRTLPLDTPGRNTQLFFLDEPTALAAGHRPCSTCRYAAFRAYGSASGLIRASAIDARLHAERRGDPQTARVGDLPDGAMVAVGDAACLVWDGELWQWSAGGYTGKVKRPRGKVRVLTPATSVTALRNGYAVTPPA